MYKVGTMLLFHSLFKENLLVKCFWVFFMGRVQIVTPTDIAGWTFSHKASIQMFVVLQNRVEIFLSGLKGLF